MLNLLLCIFPLQVCERSIFLQKIVNVLYFLLKFVNFLLFLLKFVNVLYFLCSSIYIISSIFTIPIPHLTTLLISGWTLLSHHWYRQIPEIVGGIITSMNINWKFYSHTVQALIGRTAVGDIPLILSLSQTPWSSSQAPSAAHRGTWAKRASGTTQRFFHQSKKSS